MLVKMSGIHLSSSVNCCSVNINSSAPVVIIEDNLEEWLLR